MIMSNIPLPLANNLQNNKASIIKQHHKRTDLLKHNQPQQTGIKENKSIYLSTR